MIQSVDVAPLAGGVGSGVAIHADGPLPVPTVGVLDGPPRIYLDFAGVRLPPGVTAEVEGPVVARRSPRPAHAQSARRTNRHRPCAPVGHRIETSERQAGKVVVILGELTQDAAAVRNRRHAGAHPERYLSRISALLSRLHALRRVVADVDRAGGSLNPNTAGPADRLDIPGHALAAGELDALGSELAAVAAPASLATTRDLLMRYCALGARAIRMRDSAVAAGDTAAARNAGSAAAGALIMLDRASRDLGYIPPP